ncbi:transcriptional regulator family: Fungal Specific TF [Paecilomyces variotii]|nr:transcriptional regulator family: Fungal Specific TF [Paecilomyces variotii]
MGREHANFPEGHPTAPQTTGVDPGFLAAQSNSRVRYVSRAFWARLCEENGLIEELLREQTRYDTIPTEAGQEESKVLSGTILSTIPSWDTEPTQSARFRPASCILNNLPSQPICDHLLQAYLWNFHPVIPIVHLPTLLEEYKRFWENHRDSHLATTMPSIPLIIAVLFAGAVVCTSRDVFDSQTQKACIVSLHRTVSEILRLSSFPRTPTIETLTAYIIVQGTFMREEEPLATCGFIGVAVRVAQMLGLHKDATHFSSNTPAQITAEVRRRVWWHIFALDVLVATAAGLPPLIDHDSFDVALPSDVREDLWDKPQAQPYMGLSNSAESDTDLNGPASAVGIFIRCRIRLRIAQRRILDTLNIQSISDTNAVKEMVSELETVRNFLELHIDRMLRLPAISGSYETNRTYVLWASLLLTTMHDKNWSLLHQLLGKRGMTDPTLRPVSLRFALFQWCWPGNHQPLHALIIMLKYLECDPIATDAVTIRKLVDETIALCDADGGVNCGINGGADVRRRPLTEGGREAWDLIRKLRVGIFVKIGLDPDILPTRDQVVDSARRRLDNMEMSPNTLVKGDEPTLHDTLSTIANDT